MTSDVLNYLVELRTVALHHLAQPKGTIVKGLHKPPSFLTQVRVGFELPMQAGEFELRFMFN